MMADMVTAVNNNVNPSPKKTSAAASSGIAPPAVALKITKHDVDVFVQVCQVLQQESTKTTTTKSEQHQTNNEADCSSTTGDDRTASSSPSLAPESKAEPTASESNVCVVSTAVPTLCENLYEAAEQHCQHLPAMRAFLKRMKSTAAGLSPQEVKAGILIFHDMDKSAKLRELFVALGNPTQSSLTSKKEQQCADISLDRQGALSLFRSILFSICCCIQNNDGDIKGNGTTKTETSLPSSLSSSEPQERQNKNVKLECEDDDKGEKQHKPEDALSAPSSFDSSLAPLQDEDETANQSYSIPAKLRQEIEDVCKYAADKLVEFAQKDSQAVSGISTTGNDPKQSQQLVTFEIFGHWYNAEGNRIVPWLELLHPSKWKSSFKSSSKSSTTKRLTIKTATKQLEDVTNVATNTRSTHCKNNSKANSEDDDSPASLMPEEAATVPSSAAAGAAAVTTSRTLVSFDFSGSDHPTPLLINITEGNLRALHHLVQSTGLIHRPVTDVCKELLKLARRRRGANGESLITLTRNKFFNSIDKIMMATDGNARKQQQGWNRLSIPEREYLKDSLMTFFSCFENNKEVLKREEVDVKEFAVGFCFFCAGSKSSKLATGFELLDERQMDHLSQAQLVRYLGSYLTVLVAMSLLKPMDKKRGSQSRMSSLSPDHMKAIRSAVENGAIWTFGHFLKFLGPQNDALVKDQFTFQVFANWYSTGGYSVAPWLELLDLKKLLSLIGPETLESSKNLFAFPDHNCVLEDTPGAPGAVNDQRRQQRRAPIATAPRDRASSLRRHHNSLSRQRNQPQPEILFTFPLANRRSLIVLKEDATYVRGVVELLGLLSMTPDELWSVLTSTVKKRMKNRNTAGKAKEKGGTVYVDTDTFVNCMMEEVCGRHSKHSRKRRGGPGSAGVTWSALDRSSIQERLSNFFQCFDIDQADSVALDELMGGLTLLCGGKKSTKLSFAFGVFDTRPGSAQNKKKRKKDQAIAHSLSGEDLFLFLRSILIVTFSCCRQSLDMTDENVGRCIADTANMICNDVMRHQWDVRQNDRVNFDEFGQWYNDGGFERAPWLELLDLKKWVLVDNFDTLEKQVAPGQPASLPSQSLNTADIVPAVGAPPSIPKEEPSPQDPDCPPPPPDDSLDPAFFDENGIMGMDSIDEMDMMLMDENKDSGSKLPPSSSFGSYSPRAHPGQSPRPPSSQPRQQRSGECTANPLKFHLVTYEEHGGYMLSISQLRIRQLRRVLEETGLHDLDAEKSCNEIFSQARTKSSANSASKCSTLSKKGFDTAMRKLIPALAPRGRNKSGNSETQRILTGVLDDIYYSFDRQGSGKPSAIEVACGFTVLCRGKKSDKLEFAFEILDKNKRGRLSQQEMTNFFQSFLTVLLSISFSSSLENDPAVDTLSTMKGSHCERSFSTVVKAGTAGANWAAGSVFSGFQNKQGNGDNSMSFDDFADWYTNIGFSSIPWLELLDMHKWVMSAQ